MSALTARYHQGARVAVFFLTAMLNILLLTFNVGPTVDIHLYPCAPPCSFLLMSQLSEDLVVETSTSVSILVLILAVLHTLTSLVLLLSFFTLKVRCCRIWCNICTSDAG